MLFIGIALILAGLVWSFISGQDQARALIRDEQKVHLKIPPAFRYILTIAGAVVLIGTTIGQNRSSSDYSSAAIIAIVAVPALTTWAVRFFSYRHYERKYREAKSQY